MTNKRKAEVLYRAKKYGKWQSAKILVPDEITDIKEYVKKDLLEMGIQFREITIENIKRT